MSLEIYYLLRSKSDGKYLAALPEGATSGYLLLFKEDFDALSYLNTHAADFAHRFAVESLPNSQVSTILKRWGFSGIGVVNDVLIPKIEFLLVNS
ncbi:hypothetical protein [Calothrix sp. 336/3]|uniref:hypothetical protein n=1 Tax=Calothrix sp. 336/3 TaxID=1337936 RepID=UPI0004E33422|nr:hypothetical protein [Calothrix sp. 336/3]AKG21900.1 hypothetical protein IJ00_12065 [Calothrix sp. 336/3]